MQAGLNIILRVVEMQPCSMFFKCAPMGNVRYCVCTISVKYSFINADALKSGHCSHIMPSPLLALPQVGPAQLFVGLLV